jgi:hypothetical protein
MGSAADAPDVVREAWARYARGGLRLQAWSVVLQLGDAAGITTIAGFDAQFPLPQSLFNWNQDLEMELGNAGLADPAKLHARIAVGQELARRFTDVNPLTAQNWRRAIAEWPEQTRKDREASE